jgi:hypothetical protein
MHATCTDHHSLLDLITVIIFAAEYKLKVPHFEIVSILLSFPFSYNQPYFQRPFLSLLSLLAIGCAFSNTVRRFSYKQPVVSIPYSCQSVLLSCIGLTWFHLTLRPQCMKITVRVPHVLYPVIAHLDVKYRSSLCVERNSFFLKLLRRIVSFGIK